MNNTVDNLTIAVNRSSQNIDSLTAQAAEDRQQAAIDRQTWQSEIQRIWQYLERQTGNGREVMRDQLPPVQQPTTKL